MFVFILRLVTQFEANVAWNSAQRSANASRSSQDAGEPVRARREKLLEPPRIAGAASKGGGSSSSGSSSRAAARPRARTGPRASPPRRSDEKALTGATADKVKASALAKVPAATVERLETDADQGAAYAPHVRKSVARS